MSTNPTETELTLLKALWAHGRLSAREIHEATEGTTNWSFSATRKTLERMEGKGLVRIEPLHGIKTYLAAHGKIEVMAGLISRFASRVLDSDTPLPAAAFTGSKLLAPDEVEELEAMLERLADEDKA